MKQLLFFFLFTSNLIFAQNFEQVDAVVKKYPRFSSAQQLAQKIDSDFSTQENKVRAIYTWLALNIRYDLAESLNPKSLTIRFSYGSEEEKQAKIQQIKDDIVDEAFRTKSAICEGYAQSFNKVCNLLGIESLVIKGYARNTNREIGIVPNDTNHAWNVVKLNNEWYWIDATWGAGYVMNGRWNKHFNSNFFFTPTKKLRSSHFPEAKKWQLIGNFGTIDSFVNQPLFGEAFFTENYELVSPKNGVLSKGSTVTMQIKGLKSTDRVLYGFPNSRYGNRVVVNFTKSVGSFKIPLPNRTTELLIFINGKLALEYLVQ